ncbi:MAG: tRNA (adenosine(37)-N6)-threonylcarbamoyltransferase complex ATPase subunit type 1 TsaE [Patescibacteria group bacterium]|nr:tRNA (adenosine(37)-N6)-threonylcarbamoyltransferase complex ATPase subunit type 1 TsaE [Patescibacteria group bacterium]
MKTIISKSEQDTTKIAAKIAEKLKGGEILALEGDLGAGKTTFAQALGHAFGIKKHITSPTFVLMKVYELGAQSSGLRALIHVDCYRLDEPQELFYLGLEEYLNNPNSVVVIEWADKIKNYLKKFKKVIWLKIKTTRNGREFLVVRH